MKTSIIYLGIALITFSNVIPALSQESFIKGESLAQTVSSNQSKDRNTFEMTSDKSNSNKKKDVVSFDPETITAPSYQKTIEEIMAEDNQITEGVLSPESTANQNLITVEIDGIPAGNQKSAEETILEDSQIIESPLSTTNQLAVLSKSKN